MLHRPILFASFNLDLASSRSKIALNNLEIRTMKRVNSDIMSSSSTTPIADVSNESTASYSSSALESTVLGTTGTVNKLVRLTNTRMPRYLVTGHHHRC
jgi:hypothetical protein